jgi:hypothetical protein
VGLLNHDLFSVACSVATSAFIKCVIVLADSGAAPSFLLVAHADISGIDPNLAWFRLNYWALQVLLRFPRSGLLARLQDSDVRETRIAIKYLAKPQTD